MFFRLNIFRVRRRKDRACPRRKRGRERERAEERERIGGWEGDVSVFSLFSLPAVNLVGFSVTFIREGDLVHLKRQMKELEANYQEIEKR